MEKLTRAFTRIDHALSSLLRWVTITFFVVLTVILTWNIVNRYFPIVSLTWLDEIVELSFACLVFYGAAAVWMARGHFSAGDWITPRLKWKPVKTLYSLLLELIELAFIVIFLKYSFDLTVKSREVTAVFQIPKAVLYSCMPVSALVMAAYSLVRFIAGAGELRFRGKGAPESSKT